MYVCTSEIVKKANKIVALCGTRDPHKIETLIKSDYIEDMCERSVVAWKE